MIISIKGCAMEKISFVLPVFEGPLDLLLHLISKNKLNIYDIPVSELLQQYLDHIEKMKENDMEIASEFLEMAAYLVYIKTVSLLPKHEEEANSLRLELTGQLLELRAAKIAAEQLAQNACYDIFVRQSTEIEYDYKYTGKIEADSIISAYFMAVGRGKRSLPPDEKIFDRIVKRKVVSVASKVIYVLRKLWSGKKVKFRSLYENAQNKSELVAIFLAVLELVKGNRVAVHQQSGEVSLKLIDGGRK